MDIPAPPAPPGPPQPPPQFRHHSRPRLRRDRQHRVLGGVAAGVARTLGIDVLLVRVLWVIAAFLWIGIPAYVIAWIAIPADDGSSPIADRPRDFGLILGLALVGIGVLIAFDHALPHGWRADHIAAPLLLIGGGVAVLVLRRPRDPDTEEPTPTTTEPSTEPNDAIPPTMPFAHVPEAEPTAPNEPSDAVTTPTSAWTQTATWPAPPPVPNPPRERRARRPRPRPFLTPVALSVLLIGAGITSLLHATGAVDVNLTIALGLATGFVGLVLVLSTWIGRVRGLIFIGILLVAATAVSSTLDVPLRGGVGEVIYRPASTSELRHPYEHAIGHMVLDLRNLPATGFTDVDAELGVGQLEVDVPARVRIDVNADAGAGALTLFGHESNGWDIDQSVDTKTTSANGILHLDLRVGAGHIEVRRFQSDGSELIGGITP